MPEETEDNEGVKIAVIWDFERTVGMTGAAVQPVDKPADNMAAIARLAFDTLSCNCTNFPSVGNVMITPSSGLIAQQMQNLDISALADEHVDLVTSSRMHDRNYSPFILVFSALGLYYF